MANPATGAFAATVEWGGPATLTGTLHAIQIQLDGTGLPIGFDGYGARAGVSLADSASGGGRT